jgi:hypothetical protein
VRGRYLNAEALPASTTLAVAKFARRDALLEIEAVAVLAAPATRRRSAASARKGKPARRAKK